MNGRTTLFTGNMISPAVSMRERNREPGGERCVHRVTAALPLRICLSERTDRDSRDRRKIKMKKAMRDVRAFGGRGVGASVVASLIRPEVETPLLRLVAVYRHRAGQACRSREARLQQITERRTPASCGVLFRHVMGCHA